ncbi:uncharacterized protein LOC119688596 [Teleopsis dalmanni]|uniref:uncharacterized protein LOC119688596 n=1 Tax=Teleopsis dalmanni TaxID=139649 RepID=UPI0018CF7566|nr:uncharacterized protein LOC119688596 [Teleopsis dalmanni]
MFSSMQNSGSFAEAVPGYNNEINRRPSAGVTNQITEIIYRFYHLLTNNCKDIALLCEPDVRLYCQGQRNHGLKNVLMFCEKFFNLVYTISQIDVMDLAVNTPYNQIGFKVVVFGCFESKDNIKHFKHEFKIVDIDSNYKITKCNFIYNNEFLWKLRTIQ